MSIRALVIAADGKPSIRRIDTNLADLKEVIGGGWLEPIGPTDGSPAVWHGYVDEEGKLKGLPVNEVATAVADRLGWTGALAGDVLVGTAVFLGTDPANPHAESEFPVDLLEHTCQGDDDRTGAQRTEGCLRCQYLGA